MHATLHTHRIQFILTVSNLCGEHWEVVSIVPAENTHLTEKKHQMQELKASHRNHLIILHMKANLSISCTFKKLSIWQEMCEKISVFFPFFSFYFKTKNRNALCANPGANHEHACMRARPHANVSSVVHYNSTPDLEEWHSSRASLAPARSSAKEGKRG